MSSIESGEAISKRQSDTFWALKALFIFTIVFAHMPYGGGGILTVVCRYIGVVGVPSFLMISGFFDFGSRSPWQHRIKSLLIPLFIWGTVTYALDLISNLRSEPSFTDIFLGWLKWTYGCGTWLYFVPMLLWCMVLTRYVNKWVLIIIGLISTSLGVGVIPYNEVLTPYVNPFNFIFYFSLGRLAREYQWDWDKDWLVITAIIVAIASLVIWNEERPHYVNLCCIPFCVSIFIISWNIFNKVNCSWVIGIGKVSFVIYFCHMQIVGKVNSILSFLVGSPAELSKYPIAFLLTVIFVYVLHTVLKKTHHETVLKNIGFRA